MSPSFSAQDSKWTSQNAFGAQNQRRFLCAQAVPMAFHARSRRIALPLLARGSNLLAPDPSCSERPLWRRRRSFWPTWLSSARGPWPSWTLGVAASVPIGLIGNRHSAARCLGEVNVYMKQCVQGACKKKAGSTEALRPSACLQVARSPKNPNFKSAKEKQSERTQAHFRCLSHEGFTRLGRPRRTRGRALATFSGRWHGQRPLECDLILLRCRSQRASRSCTWSMTWRLRAP